MLIIKSFTNHFFTILSVALLSLTVGIANVWPTILIANFNENNPDEQIPFYLSFADYSNIIIMTIFSIGIMYPAAYISERYGRKFGLLLSSFLYVLSWLIILLIHTYTAFYTAAFFINLGKGIFLTIMPVYLSEILKNNERGQYTTFLPYMMMIGETIEIVISLYVSWAVLIGINLIFSLLFIIVFASQYESPYFYLIHNRKEEAEEAFKSFLEIDDVSKELDNAEKFVEGKNYGENVTQSVVKIQNIKMFLIISLVFIIQILSEGSGYSYWIRKIYEISHVNEYTKIQFCLMMLNIVIGIFPVITVDRFGRKYLLCISIFGVFIFQIFSGIYFYYEIHEPIEALKFHSTFMGLFIVTIILTNIGLTSIPYTLTSELFSMKFKSYANATIQSIIVIFYIINTACFNKSVNNNQIFINYWIFACISLLGFIVILFFLPETKRLSLLSLQESLK